MFNTFRTLPGAQMGFPSQCLHTLGRVGLAQICDYHAVVGLQ